MNFPRRSGLVFLCLFASAAMAGGALPQQVYVWQRAWTPPVGAAVAAHGANFSEMAVLLAEVSWKPEGPQVARAAVDYPLLAKSPGPVGLVLRIGPFPGELANHAAAVDFLASLAGSLAAEARKNRIEPAELQIDFDCATARLDDYRAWLAVVQQRLAPLPVTITALPGWLESPAFARLAAKATNYVLQVHSLVRPADIHAPFSLCDPVVAKRAVARAGALGVPFRVALPTYAYLVAFNAAGKFIGLSAEAPRAGWPAGTQLREMSADPLAMSALVQNWNTNRPAAMRGILWYRLPVAADNLNWRWPTLAAIIAGRVPRENFQASVRRVEPGLLEISLENTGELDLSSRLAVAVHWSAARLVAGDALHGFELFESDGAATRFQSLPPAFRLAAGEKQQIGWLRFDHEPEVHLDAKTF